VSSRYLMTGSCPEKTGMAWSQDYIESNKRVCLKFEGFII